MSECILYLLDAPGVATRETAASFIERWESREGSVPNKKIASFLQEVHQAYPGKADSSIWYEEMPREPVTKPLLQMDLRLDLVDETLLERLRKIAGTHRLHIFDPEGDVLYLADGGEESTSALRERTKPRSSDATRSPEGLRFDGVYVCPLEEGASYYRFTPDGEAYRVADVNRDPKRAFQTMTKADPAVAHGSYTINSNRVHAKIRAAFGIFMIEANILDDGLAVTSVRSDGQYRHSATYHFKTIR
jgi:hypothetical protein